ncbi:hypothetical protein GCM10027592_29800 [Spirosoma flavus]
MKTGVELIAEERDEQINKHGWSAERDDANDKGQLTEAAIFALTGDGDYWPETWSYEFADKINAKTHLESLIVAGAFIAAEIDRLLRQ